MEQRKEKNICISTDDDILNILNISTALATEPQLLPPDLPIGGILDIQHHRLILVLTIKFPLFSRNLILKGSRAPVRVSKPAQIFLESTEPVRAVFKSTAGIIVFKSMIPIFLGETYPISSNSIQFRIKITMASECGQK